MDRQRLIIFTRYPVPGRTKTRLIPALGREGAAELHRRMTEHTLWVARGGGFAKPGCLEVCYSGGDLLSMRNWLGDPWGYRPQSGGDLGERMAHAFQAGFAAGKRRIVLIGTDCPGLSSAHLRLAFLSLRNHDVVLGPSHDGGYYLLGLRRMVEGLFSGIAWGGRQVYAQTLKKARAAGLLIRVLNPLSDVDHPEDLDFWYRAERSALSVVIPTHNEEDHIGETLSHLDCGAEKEVIVVDGGSRDRTAETAEKSGARVMVSPSGRGIQMNAGARSARGDVLLFVHADSLMPPGYGSLIRTALRDPQVVGGYFRMRFFPSTFFLRYLELTVDLRTRIFRLPYGDQGYFVRASVFALSGGFAEIPLMEDVEFIKRLRRLGRLAYIQSPVKTSARRFERLGAMRALLRNRLTFLGYKLGVSPERLARWYYKDR
jgi:rSAM/selenodomain-associated transferase 2/rSAM/selenodomain-associated transferase 1